MTRLLCLACAALLVAVPVLAKAAEIRDAIVGTSIAEAAPADVQLVNVNAVADVYVDAADASVVQIAAKLLGDDVERVTRRHPVVRKDPASLSRDAVLIGTLGHSAVIDRLVRDKKIDVAALDGKWESFLLQTVQNPLPGVERALVIVGSDRRGTAYGVFELSEQIGVSPWYWWADVAPTHRDQLLVKAGTHLVGPPSVKYRGIFINDEDWGLQRWAAKTVDPELKNIGPKTYEKVFELLLRLKANYLWPAMHQCSTEFGSIDENIALADRWGIVMGASHCEPINRNNVWWDQKTQGPWRYDTNRDGMIKYWDEWAEKRGKYEAVWTVGMRGIHDSGMQGPADIGDQVKLLEKAIGDQRDLLTKHVAPDITKVPQVFMPYKEALAHYQHGLKLPDDVTILWCEDNFGFIRQLSNAEEQKRSGGSGVYYHISYLGRPLPYLWLNTTPPALIWTEMTKALSYGADRIWVLNVGDIKPGEVGIDFWTKLAWDKNRYGPDAQTVFLKEWATAQFGSENCDAIAAVMNGYYQLGFQRKPELMADGVFSAIHYDEAQHRRDAYAALRSTTDSIANRLPIEKRDAFYELVQYPVKMAALMNEAFVAADIGQLYALQGRSTANVLLQSAIDARAEIERETAHYNEQLADGKWRGIMTVNGIDTRYLVQWPAVSMSTPAAEAKMGVVVEGQAVPVDAAGGQASTDVDRAAADAQLVVPWEHQRDGDVDYIVVPNGNGDKTKAGAGPTATFAIDVPHDGKYGLFALINCPTAKDDSVFVRIDDGEWKTWNDIDTQPGFQWHKQDDYTLTKGPHTVTLAQREDGLMLSRIRFTTRGSAQRLDELYPDAEPAKLARFENVNDRHFIDVFNRGTQAFDLKVTSDPWVVVEKGDGPVEGQRRLWVSLDRSKMPKDRDHAGSISLAGAGSVQVVNVEVASTDANATPAANSFVAIGGVVSIEARHFDRAVNTDDARWTSVDQLGRSGGAMTVLPATAASRSDVDGIIAHAPRLEYDVDLPSIGQANVQVECLPSHAINTQHGLRYAISMDDDKPTIVDFNETGGDSGEMSPEWQKRVSRNIAMTSTPYRIEHSGRHILKLWMVDPGVVVDKIVIDLGGLKSSEIGPSETRLPAQHP